MYIPKHFELDDEQKIFDLIETNSFATLISEHQGEPYATHLPLLLDQNQGVLYGHFARTNSQWKDIEGKSILAIFQGPHSYISPSWYETNQSVPTWNYVAVHVYGKAEILTSNEEIREHLHRLVGKYEKQDSSYQLNEVDASLFEGLRKGIVVFKIKINKMEGKAKLSQNHSIERQELVVEQLEKLDNEKSKQIAKLMNDNIRSAKSSI